MRSTLLTLLFATSFALGATKPVVYNTESKVISNKDELGIVLSEDLTAATKDFVPTTNLSVFVDLYRDGIHYSANVPQRGRGNYWSDCELKVLDKNGNIIYFFSTIAFTNKQVQALHDSKYNDTDAVVYYYVSGAGTNACVKPKKLFPKNLWNSSIGATENATNGLENSVNDNKVRITAIQIYPSAKFRDVFLNPENSIMVWRQSTMIAETDGQGGKLWRPALIQFIR